MDDTRGSNDRRQLNCTAIILLKHCWQNKHMSQVDFSSTGNQEAMLKAAGGNRSKFRFNITAVNIASSHISTATKQQLTCFTDMEKNVW